MHGVMNPETGNVAVDNSVVRIKSDIDEFNGEDVMFAAIVQHQFNGVDAVNNGARPLYEYVVTDMLAMRKTYALQA